MRFVPSKFPLSLRIAFLFSTTFVAGLCLAYAITYFKLSQSLEQSSHEVISAKFREISSTLRSEGVDGLQQLFQIEKNKLINAPFMIRVLDEDGKEVFLKKSVQVKEFDFENDLIKSINPNHIKNWQALPAINDEDKFDIFTDKVNGHYILQIGKSSEDREALLGRILRVFGISGLTLIFLSGGLSVFYSRRALKPLHELLHSISAIEKGDLSKRVQTGKTNDELKILGETFNRMIEKIEKVVSVMKESLDNVAHDIRTPLTRIRVTSEDALLKNNQNQIREALEDCAESAESISDLIDQVMSISEADAGTLKLQLESCNLRALTEEVVEVYEFVAQDKNIKIEISQIDSSIIWNLDRKRIKQVLGNLIDNALKFSPRDSIVRIFAKNNGDRLEVIVSDEGIGINHEDLPKIWDRLYRGDRSRSTKGLGLGLSIVKSIVNAHGGEVIASSLKKGTSISISLPNINSLPKTPFAPQPET